MKIVYLLPPSEGKVLTPNHSPKERGELLSFNFKKPLNIAKNVTEKDLKCSWNRFAEGVELNKNIAHWETIEAINRYSWVMFNAIDYAWMSESGKEFFEENFLIFSWMYGIVKPLDKIWNYKLPIESKWLYEFWGTQIIEELNKMWVEKVINLLPISYAKLIYWKNKSQEKVFSELRKFEVEDKIFYKEDWKRMTHWVKKVKGEWVKELCENS